MLNRKAQDIIAIDLSGDEFVLAHFKASVQKKEIIRLISYGIRGMSEDDIVKLVKKEVKELKVNNPYIINIIPLHLAITKNLEIPSVDAQEIKEIVDLQSGRQTPYSRDEIIIDYISVGSYRQSYTKILLVIVTRAAARKQYNIMEKAGLKTENIFFAPEGVSTVCAKQLKGDLLNNPFGILHIDANFTDFIVSLKGIPVFTRSIPIGTNHFASDNEKFMNKFIDELKSSLETYQSEDIEQPLQLLMLAGAIEQIKDLEANLSARFNIPLKTLSYLKIMPVSAHLALPAKNISFFNVSAAVLAAKTMRVDLIPDEVKLKRSFEERAYELVKMGVYIICFFLLAAGLLINKLYFRGEYLKLLKSSYQATNQEASLLEKAMEKVRIVRHHLKNRGYPLKVLMALYDIVPKSILITDVKMDVQRNLFLKGTARSMADVFSFVVLLEDSEYFKNVKTNYTSSRKEENEDWADFGISCVLENNPAEDSKHK